MPKLPPDTMSALPAFASPLNAEPALFALGCLVATPAALDLLNQCGVSALDIICRHASGDWGDLDACDARANAEALTTGARLMSVYTLRKGDTRQTLWVITDAAGDDGQRPATTLLRPGDY